MFYNHEILTSRKHGVATIWLMATLGSKSSLKKVGRKAIIDVNIKKACETIITPEAPMALRLQSSLLYGVSRVYSQQCGYVLADVQTTHNGLKQTHLAMVKAVQLDQDKSKSSKPDQLLLPDDPDFDPNLALGLLTCDLDLPDLVTDVSSTSSGLSLSPRGPESRRASHGSLPGIIIPSSSSPGGGEFGGFDIGDDANTTELGGLPLLAQRGLARAEQGSGLLSDVGFTFDANGDIKDSDTLQNVQHQRRNTASEKGSRRDTTPRQIEDGEEDLYANFPNNYEDFDAWIQFPNDNDDAGLPDAEPFPPRQQLQHEQEIDVQQVSSAQAEEVEEEERSVHADAPLTRHRRRPVKFLKADHNISLHNSDIAAWSRNYLDNMAKAMTHKMTGKRLALAKKNVDYYLFERGIGGVGSILSKLGIEHPFNAFYGDKLRDLLTSNESTGLGQKRSHEEAEDIEIDDDNDRPAKRLNQGPETAPEEDAIMGDEDQGFVNTGEDEELEVGRRASTPTGSVTQDLPSVMPWNIGASHRSSTIEQGRAAPGSLVGGSASSITPLQGVFRSSRRGSRMVTPSPLDGRARIMDPVATTGSGAPPRASSSPAADTGFEMPLGEEQDDVMGGMVDEDEFALFGPATYVDTQTAAQSQWIRQALDREGQNFLHFVQTQLASAPPDEEGKRRITFETLLPIASNTKIVAAQGFMHALSLATKRLIEVTQEEDFADIWLEAVEAA